MCLHKSLTKSSGCTRIEMSCPTTFNLQKIIQFYFPKTQISPLLCIAFLGDQTEWPSVDLGNRPITLLIRITVRWTFCCHIRRIRRRHCRHTFDLHLHKSLRPYFTAYRILLSMTCDARVRTVSFRSSEAEQSTVW